MREERRANSIQSMRTEMRILAMCTAIMAVIGIAAALYWLKPVVVPFFIAIFFSMVLSPMIQGLNRFLKLPHVIAMILVLILAIIVFLLVGSLVSVSLTQLAQSTDDYAREFAYRLSEIIQSGQLERFGIEKTQEARLERLIPIDTMQGFVVGLANGTLRIMSQSMLVLVFVIFMLLDPRPVNPHAPSILNKVRDGIRRYILTKFFTSAITGVLVFCTLHVLGVRHAITFGTFAFLLNFIPSIGSIVSTLLPLPVVLLTPNFPIVYAILAVVIPGVIQFSIGNLIEPKIMGESLDLHPIVVLLALIFWGMLWGVEGMLMAVPLTAIVKIVLERGEFGQQMAHLLAGRLDRAGLEG